MRILTNFSHLNDAIDYYEKINNRSPYLFMSKETREKIGCYVNIGMFNSSLEYDGCKVFEDNMLDLFKIELR